MSWNGISGWLKSWNVAFGTCLLPTAAAGSLLLLVVVVVRTIGKGYILMFLKPIVVTIVGSMLSRLGREPFIGLSKAFIIIIKDCVKVVLIDNSGVLFGKLVIKGIVKARGWVTIKVVVVVVVVDINIKTSKDILVIRRKVSRLDIIIVQNGIITIEKVILKALFRDNLLFSKGRRRLDWFNGRQLGTRRSFRNHFLDRHQVSLGRDKDGRHSFFQLLRVIRAGHAFKGSIIGSRLGPINREILLIVVDRSSSRRSQITENV
mmetsp:Transcript_43794/g.105649  ORF Transcript_43794/g.105649 Transcript_43794/m.105649 type:complete len:262 (-) Transcript_43794:358-1143(-)